MTAPVPHPHRILYRGKLVSRTWYNNRFEKLPEILSARAARLRADMEYRELVRQKLKEMEAGK